MAWYDELSSLKDVADFTRFITKNHGKEMGKVMPQCLRMKQLVIGDSVFGTWQTKEKHDRIAELLSSYGHGGKKVAKVAGGPDKTVAMSESETVIRAKLGQWVSIAEQMVQAAQVRIASDPSVRANPKYGGSFEARDKGFYMVASEQLAQIAPNTASLLQAFSSIAAGYDEPLGDAYTAFRKYQHQQAVAEQLQREHAEAADVEKLSQNPGYAKRLSKLREHQKTKIQGKMQRKLRRVKGAHQDGQFWMLDRAIDGMPVLLVSSDLEKPIDAGYKAEAKALGSAVTSAFTSGTFHQSSDSGPGFNIIYFDVKTGIARAAEFNGALESMLVFRKVEAARGRKA